MKRSWFLVAAAALVLTSISVVPAGAAYPAHRVTGKILSVSGNTLVVERRNGSTVTVDITDAVATKRQGIIAPMVALVAHGSFTADGTFHCVYTSHASPNLMEWANDQ